MTSSSLFQLLHLGGLAVYGLSLLYFSVRLRAPWDQKENVDRVRQFLRWGPVLGISMGALIAGGLGLFFLQQGGFVWETSTNEGLLTLLKHLGFLFLWISHFHLEIWTQDPLRKLDGPTGPTDPSSWSHTAQRVRLQLRLNAVVFSLLFGLSIGT